jgi:hypothetical protein
VKRRKKRGVYFINRPAPTERAWLQTKGATEEDLAFPDPKTVDFLAGLFVDPGLKERSAPLLEKLKAPSARALLFDDDRGALFRAFLGIGPADRAADHPEGIILVRPPDPRARIPGLPDDAPGARDLIPLYRGGLGALCGGDDRLGLALPGEVLLWSKARKHDLNAIEFLPEHRTRNLRIFWDAGDGCEAVFDATGRVYEYRGGDRLTYSTETVMRYLEEKVLRIAAGKTAGEPLSPEEIEALAPGHPLADLKRVRALDIETADPVEIRAAVRKAEGALGGREEVIDVHLGLLAREERWDEFIPEMRRAALGPWRSVVDRPIVWRWLARASETKGRPDFRDIAMAATAGPLGSESRGAIGDILIDSGEMEGALAFLEKWMRPGAPLDPALAVRLERVRLIRHSRF